MAGNLSNYAEAKILQHSVGAATWSPVTAYVGLFTTAPDDTATASNNGTYTGEVSGNGYARQTTTWGSPSYSSAATTISNSAAITFPTATGGAWGSIVAVGIFDAATGGNLIWWGTLLSPKTVGLGETFQFGVGALSLSLD